MASRPTGTGLGASGSRIDRNENNPDTVASRKLTVADDSVSVRRPSRPTTFAPPGQPATRSLRHAATSRTVASIDDTIDDDCEAWSVDFVYAFAGTVLSAEIILPIVDDDGATDSCGATVQQVQHSPVQQQVVQQQSSPQLAVEAMPT